MVAPRNSVDGCGGRMCDRVFRGCDIDRSGPRKQLLDVVLDIGSCVCKRDRYSAGYACCTAQLSSAQPVGRSARKARRHRYPAAPRRHSLALGTVSSGTEPGGGTSRLPENIFRVVAGLTNGATPRLSWTSLLPAPRDVSVNDHNGDRSVLGIASPAVSESSL